MTAFVYLRSLFLFLEFSTSFNHEFSKYYLFFLNLLKFHCKNFFLFQYWQYTKGQYFFSLVFIKNIIFLGAWGLVQYRSFITSRRSYSWTIFTNVRERSDHSWTFVNVHNYSQSFVNVRERSWMIILNHSWTFVLIPGTFMNVRLLFLYLKLIKSS